ncbi:Na+/H+ antiporter NhaA [Sphingomonas lutea]|uniref:Na(+)/H(+) antiporter NhaA n=1 Tax=Sphingomonas lutea TaxID=1045317 RepID=A0A7G9SJS6_9SPHN|nr:Na+/H+ antiporter NhaA [Sphingomonas lutea]QNN68101.1 Na+/H+ antiporter NhaA [Sphingomonas lutea]
MSRRPISITREFLTNEASGGILLIAAAAVALVIANSPAAPAYFGALQSYLGPLSVLHWINDALMAGFFLLVGLEIKREFLDGELANPADRRLPIIAAAAGMAGPALIYLVIVGPGSDLARGWAVPAATDIAFALGVLALLGKRVPASLKLFLTTVAVVDDIGAVAIIAVAYTSDLNLAALAAAAAILAGMAALNRAGVQRLSIYLLLAAALWVATYASGVHATVAGVLAALTIPIRPSPGAPDDMESPLHRLEHALEPWVGYLIVPLFGFANAGVSLAGLNVAALLAPLPLAVAAGLFVGKQVAIFGSVRLAVAFGWGSRPRGATWLQVYGIAILCGIGFTMSLFIGTLAFSDPQQIDDVKLGILSGSFLSAIVGFAIIRFAARPKAAAGNPQH